MWENNIREVLKSIQKVNLTDSVVGRDTKCFRGYSLFSDKDGDKIYSVKRVRSFLKVDLDNAATQEDFLIKESDLPVFLNAIENNAGISLMTSYIYLKGKSREMFLSCCPCNGYDKFEEDKSRFYEELKTAIFNKTVDADFINKHAMMLKTIFQRNNNDVEKLAQKLIKKYEKDILEKELQNF